MNNPNNFILPGVNRQLTPAEIAFLRARQAQQQQGQQPDQSQHQQGNVYNYQQQQQTSMQARTQLQSQMQTQPISAPAPPTQQSLGNWTDSLTEENKRKVVLSLFQA